MDGWIVGESRRRSSIYPSIHSSTNPKSSCRRQLQKWNHPFLQFRRRQIQNRVQRRRIRHVKLAGNAAPQRRQMRAAAEFLAEIVRDAANISALGAGDFDLAERQLIICESKIINVDEARLADDFD